VKFWRPERQSIIESNFGNIAGIIVGDSQEKLEIVPFNLGLYSPCNYTNDPKLPRNPRNPMWPISQSEATMSH
jgi:hypothetical protein